MVGPHPRSPKGPLTDTSSHACAHWRGGGHGGGGQAAEEGRDSHGRGPLTVEAAVLVLAEGEMSLWRRAGGRGRL